MSGSPRFSSKFFLLLCLAARAEAANPITELVQQWFNAEWASCDQLPPLGDVAIQWALVLPPPDAVRRAEVLREYGTSDVRLETEPVVRTLWIQGVGAWRINFDYSGGLYSDTVVTPRQAWRMTQDVLLLAQRDGGEPGGAPLASLQQMFGPELALLLYGGLSQAKLGGFQPGAIEVQRHSWTMPLIRPGPDDRIMEVTLRGRWDPEAQRGFVEESRVGRNPARPQSVGEIRRFQDWQHVGDIDRWVASRVVVLAPDGNLARTLEFVGVRTDIPFAAVIEPPPHDGNDAVRGRVTYRQINDTRERRVTNFGATAGSPSVVRYHEESEREWRRWLGWLTAIALAVGLAMLGIRRHIQQRTC
jgi:hypothetical protein